MKKRRVKHRQSRVHSTGGTLGEIDAASENWILREEGSIQKPH